MSKIKLLLADDQTMIREGLKVLLSEYEDIDIIGEAENGRQLLEKAASLLPDVILSDIRMPVMDGVEAAKEIKRRHPDMVVIMLTTFDDDAYIIEAMAGGAAGYLLKDISSDKLAQAIRDASQGNLILPGRIAAKITAYLTGDLASSGMNQSSSARMPLQQSAEQNTAFNQRTSNGQTHLKADKTDDNHINQHEIDIPASAFSAREQDIIKLMLEGQSNRDIAETLFLTVGTVKNYISQIYLKLGVNDRTNAVIILKRYDWGH